MCCRPPKDNNEGKSDVKQAAGKWGNYGDCDAPYWLFKDMMENIGKKHGDEQLIDFEEYYLNLTEANANPDAPTEWKQLYSSAKEEYGLKSLSVSEWNDLIERMMKNDTLFNTYHKNFYRRTDSGIKPCAGGCKTSFLCGLKRSHHSNNFCKNMNKEDFSPDPNRKVQKKIKKENFEGISKINWRRTENGISKIKKFKQNKKIEEFLKKIDISKIKKFDSGKCPI
ncbi:hypothetical protein FO519_009828 [Halicephalobus sp. NKZ332]|nr:hypothetical protein FO519_009828 [Halicephalobus sp. NKZ332]